MCVNNGSVGFVGGGRGGVYWQRRYITLSCYISSLVFVGSYYIRIFVSVICINLYSRFTY